MQPGEYTDADAYIYSTCYNMLRLMFPPCSCGRLGNAAGTGLSYYDPNQEIREKYLTRKYFGIWKQSITAKKE